MVDGGGVVWILKAVLEHVSWFAKEISKLQSCNFCEQKTNHKLVDSAVNTEDFRSFQPVLLQDWLAPSRVVLAPDPLRLSGAFAAAKAAAQLATAKVGVHCDVKYINL